MLLFFLERLHQYEPEKALFCKLNIRFLLFSIKGISSFEKVPK